MVRALGFIPLDYGHYVRIAWPPRTFKPAWQPCCSGRRLPILKLSSPALMPTVLSTKSTRPGIKTRADPS